MLGEPENQFSPHSAPCIWKQKPVPYPLKSAIILTFACFGLVIVKAAETTKNSELDSLKVAAERVMVSLSHNRTDETFAELLKPFWPFTGEATARGEKLASDLRASATRMESTIGKRSPGRYEFLGSRRLGNTYLTLVYVLKYQHGGLLVEFMFYNKGSVWLLNNANWTSNPADNRVLWSRVSNPVSSDLKPIRQATEQAVKSLSNGLTNNAFADLWNAYAIPGVDAAAQAESVASFTQSKKGQIEGTFGKPLPGRYEFLGAMRLGRSYLTLVYVQKYEYAAMPVSFLFYQSEQKWFLNNVSLADSAQSDLTSLTVNESAIPK